MRTARGTLAILGASVSLVAGLAIAARALHLNAAATALLLQLAVVGVSTVGSRSVAIAAALTAAGALTLFLHPLGSFRVSDPENWIVLGSFLLASLVAARLVARARAEAAAAAAGRDEVASLYRFRVELFSDGARDFAATARRALEVLHARRGGVLGISRDGERAWIAWRGGDRGTGDEALAESAARASGSLLREGESCAAGFPVTGGGTLVLLAEGARGGERGVESVGALLALAAENERALAAAAHLAAVRESDAFKTSLLRAVSHDLATPLTAIGIEIDALRREHAEDPRLLARLDAAGRDASVLRRRIEALLAIGRIEAGLVAPRFEPTPPEDLFRMVREQFAIAGGRLLEIDVDPRTPDIETDPALALEILLNLVDNADRATAGSEPIALRALPAGASVRLEVADRGSGLPALAGDRPVQLADLPQRGLGLEIARSFAAVCAGSVALRAREGGGTVAIVDLPASTENPHA